ncbi:MAG TPA: 16S rRNA (cytidine(1402)-2'-O)-methyltransferase, partial [Usitatibacter sp.]
MATPIGNLGDITLRAIDVLRRAGRIAAEDTRNTRGLLNHLGIPGKLVALHAHNERRAAESLVRAIESGEAVALVSDAGTPAVSDPGAELVAAVRAAGLKVIPVPGASALTAALSASGMMYEGAVFAGFLPVKGRERREKLAALAAGPWAIVLFEAPHRIAAT